MNTPRLIACARSPRPVDDWIQKITNKAKKRGVEYGGPISLPRKTINGEEYFIRILTFSRYTPQRVIKIVDIDPPEQVRSKIEVGIQSSDIEIRDILPVDKPTIDRENASGKRIKSPIDKVTDSNESDQIESSNETDQTANNIPNRNQSTKTTELNFGINELRKRAKADSKEKVENYQSTTNTTQYTRSNTIREYTLARADGTCEGCGSEAPFLNKEGNPYLQAHHVHELSQGGSDTPATVIALCPNCHYRVHHGLDGDEYNLKLINKLKNIEN